MTDTLPAPAPLPTARKCPFDPPAELTHLRQHHPVSRLVLADGSTGWLITDYALARQVLADPRFSSRGDLIRSPMRQGEADLTAPGMFIFTDPPEHHRLRKLLTGQFTVRRMNQLEAEITRTIETRLDALEHHGPPADLMAVFAQPVATQLICHLLGVPYDQHETFERQAAAAVSLAAGPEADAAGEALFGFLYELVTSKRANPTDDMISGLVAKGELDDIAVTGMAMMLLVAGHETTASMLGLGTFALLRHPDQLAALRADPALASGAVEELLRYLSIVQYEMNRAALEDVELGGQLIKAGDPVCVSLPAANRDPNRFDRPDDLDITRSATGHLAFGHGVHQCLGQQLARIEMRVGFTALFRRFPTLRLAVSPEEVPLRVDRGIYGVYQLPVTW